MKNRLAIFGLAMILLFAIGFAIPVTLLPSSIDAQPISLPGSESSEATPDPNGPIVPASPEDEKRWADEQATLDADLTSRAMSDYAIAYLISADAAINDPTFSEQVIVDLTEAEVFYTWEAFAEVNEVQTFDIVLLDDSMFAAVDRDWAAHAYRNDVIFMGFGVTLPQFGELFDVPCLSKGARPVPDQWEYITVPGYVRNVKDAEYRDEVNKAIFEDCDQEYIINDTIVGGFNVQVMPLIKAEWIGTIPAVLAAQTYEYGKPNIHLGDENGNGE